MMRPPASRSNRGPSGIVIVIALLLLVTAVTAVASFFGEWWWFADVAANFRPQYGVALVVGAIVLFFAKWFRMGLLMLAVAALDLYPVVVLYRPSSTTPAAEAPGLRVLSFNLLATNDHYDEVLAYLKEADADVVFLHEASEPWEEAIDAASLPYQVTRSRNDLIFGTLVLTKEDAQVSPFGFEFDAERAVEVLYPMGDQTVAVLGVHPLSPTSAERARLRDSQLAFAGDWAAQQSGPAVVVGDFNATPWSHTFRKLTAEGLIDSERGFGLQPSFPVTSNIVFRVPIDHLLHTSQLAVTSRRLGPSLGSNHLPLVVDLTAAA